ncbi:SCG1 protein, partial [Oreotrochilus melanogaster]|nr:SCG1 protein [Oreotrochilus melanogaster]
SGTTEGKERSLSSHLEESSSVLDLPSVCDLVECFLPSHSSEKSEELFCSVDTFPSPPTGVSTVPVEKDNIEEMVTRCIVEVLSNALSKPNAPPINPECKEILKKSGRNDRSENKQLEVKRLKDPAEMEKHHTGSVEKEHGQAEEVSKQYTKGSDEEKLADEGGKSKEEEDGRHTPIQEERLHTEEKKSYEEIGGEEEKGYHSEEESKERKLHDEEAEHAFLYRKPHSGGMSTEEFPEGNDLHPVGRWHLEEGMQSPYKRINEGEAGEEERTEEYHQKSKERGQQEHEESDEMKEREEEKQPYKLKHYHGKHSMGDSSEEKRGYGGEEEELAEESNTEDTSLWNKRNYRQKHHKESEQQREEKSGYHGRHGSEEVGEKQRADQGSEEYRERWQQSEESSEEDERHRHSEESGEKWFKDRRHRDGSHEVGRHHSEGRTYLGDESKEELDGYPGSSSKDRQHRAGGRPRPWDNEDEGSQKAYAREHKGEARRNYYSSEESVEQHQRYPGKSEEEKEVEKKYRSSDQMENEEENMEDGRYAEREEYRSSLPAEKRTIASYSSFYPLLWWKSQRFEKRNGAGEQLLKGKEEGRHTLKEKSLFPEYDDYDWWEKKQILSALKPRRTEKNNLGKIKRYDMKRQYKIDQLAQLLNYRKKSDEFPELYNSGEDLKKHHLIRNDRGSLSQRPLTEEEEKELENLAAMDLELQKIAEKFNDNRRG